MNFIKKTIVFKKRANFSLVKANALLTLQKNYSGVSACLMLSEKMSCEQASVLIIESADGDIHCFSPAFSSGKEEFTLSKDFDLQKGASAYILNGDKSEVTMYGTCKDGEIRFSEIIKKYNEKMHKENEYENYLKEKTNNEHEIAKWQEYEYTDERIAEENYFKNPDVDFKHLKVNENAQTICDPTQNDDAVADGSKQEKKQEIQHTSTPNTTGLPHEESKNNECFGYYKKVKDTLKEIFDTYECESNLQNMIGGSRWAKIAYDKDKYYVVGLISHGEMPLYICYGVPGAYSEQPEILKGVSSFIPLSLFDDQTSGYWVMYQDVNTGECVNLYPV